MQLHPVHYGRKAYRNEYLKSDEWKEVRDAVLSRERGICRKCDLPKPLDVHHMDYAALGLPLEHQMPLLVGLCRECHDLVEDAKLKWHLPKVHTLEQLRAVTEQSLKDFLKQMRRRVKWTPEMTAKADAMSWRYQMQVCNTMNYGKHPGKFCEWEGRNIAFWKVCALDRIYSTFIHNPIIEKTDKPKQSSYVCRGCKQERPSYDFQRPGDKCRYCLAGKRKPMKRKRKKKK